MELFWSLFLHFLALLFGTFLIIPFVRIRKSGSYGAPEKTSKKTQKHREKIRSLASGNVLTQGFSVLKEKGRKIVQYPGSAGKGSFYK